MSLFRTGETGMLLSKQGVQTQASLYGDYTARQSTRQLEIQSIILGAKLHQKTVFLYIPAVALLIKMSHLDVPHHESTQKMPQGNDKSLRTTEHESELSGVCYDLIYIIPMARLQVGPGSSHVLTGRQSAGICFAKTACVRRKGFYKKSGKEQVGGRYCT